MKVGFLGLGRMGAAMAGNLVRAGHEVWVWNHSPEPVQALVAAGARAAASPAEAAATGVLLSMLADDAAARAVVLEGGALDALPTGGVHVVHSTLSVDCVRELAAAHAARGVGYVAAPVFGRPDVAAAGRLNILAAGAEAQVQRVRPLLDAMGARVWPLGTAPERANIVKIAGNLMLASAIETMAEASTLTRAYGVPARDFLEILTGTLFASPAYQGYGTAIAERRFTPPGFAMPLGFQDVNRARAAGQAERVPLPLASLVHDSMLEALAHGAEQQDWAALALVAEARAGLGERGK